MVVGKKQVRDASRTEQLFTGLQILIPLFRSAQMSSERFTVYVIPLKPLLCRAQMKCRASISALYLHSAGPLKVTQDPYITGSGW